MTAPKRIQRKRTKGWRMPEGAVYVGRPSRWGNPFPIDGPEQPWLALALGERADRTWRGACGVDVGWSEVHHELPDAPSRAPRRRAAGEPSSFPGCCAVP